MTIPAAVTARAARLRERYASLPTWQRCVLTFTAALVVVYALVTQPGLLVVYVLAGLSVWSPTRPHVWPLLRSAWFGGVRMVRAVWKRIDDAVRKGLGGILGLILAVVVGLILVYLAGTFAYKLIGPLLLLPLVPFLLVPGIFLAPVLVLVAIAVLALIGGWSPTVARVTGHDWAWQRDRLADVLGPMVYRDWAKFDPEKRVKVVGLTDSWVEPGAKVTLAYDRETCPTDAKEIAIRDVIAKRLGGEWQGSHAHGIHELRYFRQAPVPELPTSVAYADMPDTGRADLVPVGKDAAGKWLIVDLSKEPHILVSGTTGSGKSTEGRTLTTYLLQHGATVDICDAKQVSLLEFKGVPGVRYFDETAEWATAISEFRAKIDERKRQRKAGKDPSGEPVQILLLEEIFILINALKGHKPGGRQALTDLVAILQQGRQFKCYVVATVHDPTQQSLVSSRDQFNVKIAVKHHSDNYWRLLFGEGPRPEGSGKNVAGRAVVGTAGDLASIQLPYLSAEDARRLVLQAADEFRCCGQRLGLHVGSTQATCTVCGQSWRLPVEWCCGEAWRLRAGVGQSCPRCDRDLPWPTDEHVWGGVDSVDIGVDMGVDTNVDSVDKNGVHVSDLHVHTNGGPQTAPTVAYGADVHIDGDYHAAEFSDGPVRVDRECPKCGEVVNDLPGATPKCSNRHTVRIPKAAAAE